MSRQHPGADILLSHGIDISNRSFSITGEIEEKLFEIVDFKMSILEQASKKAPITIKLNSPGGEVSTAWAVVSRLERSPCKIHIEAHGTVASAATIILACGFKRAVSKYCSIIFHETSLEDVSGKLSGIKNLLSNWSKEQDMYIRFLADRSTKTVDFWNRVIESKKDVYLTPAQLLKIGLIDEVF